MEFRVQALFGLEAKRYKRLRRIYMITIMWVIDDKCGSLPANTGVLAYIGAH